MLKFEFLSIQVRQTQETFSQLQLDRMMTALREAVVQQNEQLNLRIARRDELRAQLQQYKDIVDQFD